MTGGVVQGEGNGGVNDEVTADRPLRVAALIKQVPLVESMRLGPSGRLERTGLPGEMNPFCRRAVSKGVEVARATGGECLAVTLGPPPAEDVLREAVAWGADRGIHLSDPAFAGSDTLATARALSAACRRLQPLDLILVGRNTIDGDTGQVGPEVAELLALPFAGGVRHLQLRGEQVRAVLELDDGWETVELTLPAVLSVAERLCEPAKVPPEKRAAVPPERLHALSAGDLGTGLWGQEGSPTVVGRVRSLGPERRCSVLTGPPEEQAEQLASVLEAAGALDLSEGDGVRPAAGAVPAPTGDPAAEPPDGAAGEGGLRGTVGVVVEPDRGQEAAELLGAARDLVLAGQEVVAIGPSAGLGERAHLFGQGADRLWALDGSRAAEDVAGAVVRWAIEHRPWAVLAPGTAFGREVAGRAAAALGAGLVGDAIGLRREGSELLAVKPALAGASEADITFRSEIALATVRPGVLPLPVPRTGGTVTETRTRLRSLRRVHTVARRRDDDLEVLARADVVIGVGTGVSPEEYPSLRSVAQVLGAELAATRKVTDRGWMPRARQVGITGRSIAPRLYVAVGMSGKFNHMVGVRAAGTVVAINHDPAAPVFSHADVGLVGDWHEVLPLLARHLVDRQLVRV